MFITCMDQFNFADDNHHIHAVRLGDNGEIERLSQSAITEELAKFTSTLKTLRELRMMLMFDIAMFLYFD